MATEKELATSRKVKMQEALVAKEAAAAKMADASTRRAEADRDLRAAKKAYDAAMSALAALAMS